MNTNTERLAKLARGWDEAAAGYEAYWVPRFAPWVRAAVDSLLTAPVPDGPILVPCCGTFPELDELVQRLPDREIVGIDLSAGMVRLARERAEQLPNVSIVQGDASSLDPRWNGVCAGVLSVFGLQQLPSPASAMRSWAGALRAGGRMSVVFWPERSERDGPFAAVRELVNPQSDELWEDELAPAAESTGASIERHEDLAFEIVYSSATEFFDSYVESGPMRASAIDRGPEYVGDLRTQFMRSAPNGEWRHRPRGRLIVAHR